MNPKVAICDSTPGSPPDIIALLQELAADRAIEVDASLNADTSLVIVRHDPASGAGADLMRTIRLKTDAPVLWVGPAGGTAMVSAILLGADAYLAEPVDGALLIARVNSLLTRWRRPARSDVNTQAGCEEDAQSSPTHLTSTEHRLFECLRAKNGALARPSELMRMVWGGEVKQERLRFFVHSLRRKLQSEGRWDIQTRKGLGYRLSPR